jgi:hypothetical protein
MSWRGGESMESLLLTTNYVPTKVSAISTKASEKYGQNRMREKGDELDGGGRRMAWVVW